MPWDAPRPAGRRSGQSPGCRARQSMVPARSRRHATRTTNAAQRRPVCPAHSYTPVAMLSTRSPAPIAPRHDRHPGRRPAGADAGLRGARHGLPHRGPGPGPGLPGRRHRGPRGGRVVRRRGGGAADGGRLRRRDLRAGARRRRPWWRRWSRRVPVRPGAHAAARDPGPPRGAPLRGGDGVASRRGARSRRRCTACERRPPVLGTAAPAQGAIGGYDGRSPGPRRRRSTRSRDAWALWAGPPASRSSSEQELAFSRSCRSCAPGRSTAPSPAVPARLQPPRRRHPRRIGAARPGPGRRRRRRPRPSRVHLADAMDAVGL